MKSLLSLVLVLFSLSVHAQEPEATPAAATAESAPTATAPESESAATESTQPRWRLNVTLFATGSNHTNYEIKQRGTTVLTTDSSDRSGRGISFAAERDFESAPFLFGAEYAIQSYKYGDGSPNDIMTTLQAYLQYCIDANSFRFAVGSGLGFLSINPRESSVTSSGIRAEIKDNIFGFVVSPRVTADYWITEKFAIGVMAMYSHSEGTAKVKLTTLSTGATDEIEFDFRRTWMSYGVRGIIEF